MAWPLNYPLRLIFSSAKKPNWLLRLFHYLFIYCIGLAVRVFANGPGDLGWIPGRVIPKTQKMVLDASLLNTQHYKVRIKGKAEQSREGVAPSHTPWCSSYRKGSLRVTLDYGRQLYLFLSLRVFGLLSSSLLLLPQRFGRYVLRPSSGVWRTREPSSRTP